MEMLLEALTSLLTFESIFTVLLGVSAGLFIGSMPGLTATMALAMLLPFTFSMEALQGLIALGAVYMGSIYGGAFTAILINTPGTPSSIATTFDGYPMARQGRAYEALAAATIASVVGGIIGVIFLLILAPPLARLAVAFGPSEMFWVAMLGLTLVASLSSDSLLKGLLAGCIGILLSTIGVSPVGGESRFTFGYPPLQGGIELIVALIGLFVVPELLTMAAEGRGALPGGGELRKKEVSIARIARHIFIKPVNLIRSCLIGQIIAIIPGAGGNVTSLVAYNEARRFSKDPKSFGKGNIDGVVASESSNNVMVAGSMVPLLTLGIPGAPPDAIILGVLLMHGLRPGLDLFTESGVLTNGFILSMGLSALMLLPVGLLGGRLIHRVVIRTPYYFLVPSIAMVTILGTFALRNSMLDVGIMLILGTAGYFLRLIGIQAAPIVLGLILGGIAEQGYVQTLMAAVVDPIPWLRLVSNPLSMVLAGMVLLGAATALVPMWLARKGLLDKVEEDSGGSS
ncbi:MULTISPECIES: tripartite tricarboxylate transporter permease [Halomonadaceae]|jgi:putative tricarboxylic transport membrane protein|uniref:tripartite tricarboxylate transporter permease n=1 Tax=Halomonadaceae TaxID=28256 RepID=UPI000A2846D2|nr:MULTISPECIES: tripartite tricarboxylate transporter permease [Halomonas]MCW4153762.1 tripartite tricarboxylate transporter permease [Halomonas sp. 18H]MDR5886315.1 tripartite tricarboxylate transporter permease [Halomonas janggokensis]QPL47104.1 tripartite tricarboxylate transporter permease [Halomonas sp. A40-4]